MSFVSSSVCVCSRHTPHESPIVANVKFGAEAGATSWASENTLRNRIVRTREEIRKGRGMFRMTLAKQLSESVKN